MRTLTAIICLTAFFALQYGKLVSYWHCRIINISAAAPCDCVKQLMDVHKDSTPHSATTLKEKTEEIFLFHETPQSWPLPVTHTTFITAYIEVLPKTFTTAIFQPPRL